MPDGTMAHLDVKAEFARRTRKRGLAMLLLLSILLVIVGVGEAGFSPVLAGLILAPAIFLIVATFVYLFRVWRCPGCNRFLGARDTAFSPGRSLNTCSKCNVRLF